MIRSIEKSLLTHDETLVELSLTFMNPSVKPQVKKIPCDLCLSDNFFPLFEKESSRNENFLIQKCGSCGLVQVNPQPDLEAVKPYYSASYFQKRTDRGYNNYFSDELKRQLFKVYEMNLNDAGFYQFEKERFYKLNIQKPSFLDVGCAAGYFVEFMKHRGWEAEGIEISNDAASFGIEQLKLKIIVDDFFSSRDLKKESYDFITLWASIEHMHSPVKVMKRIHELLKPSGRLILSTCRYGHLAKFRGKDWRYMNVPEHLYFYSMKNMKRLAAETGFNTLKSFSYGSGFTAKKDSGFAYKAGKIIMDPLVKILNQGDMMVFYLKKI